MKGPFPLLTLNTLSTRSFSENLLLRWARTSDRTPPCLPTRPFRHIVLKAREPQVWLGRDVAATGRVLFPHWSQPASCLLVQARGYKASTYLSKPSSLKKIHSRSDAVAKCLKGKQEQVSPAISSLGFSCKMCFLADLALLTRGAFLETSHEWEHLWAGPALALSYI